MRISVLAVLAMLAFAGCMNDSDGDPAATTDGTVDGMPRLYSELDSIVFNRWDFVYVLNREWEPTLGLSAEAREMLTDDTLLFRRDTVYPYGDDDPIEAIFLRTKFNPKGWIAFYDAENALACKAIENEPTGEWLLKHEIAPDVHRACYRTSGASPSRRQFWPTHYQDKGFELHASTVIADPDFGEARIYYWR